MSLNFTGSTPLWIVLLFAAGLVCIIKGGDLFVDAAGWIAEASGIPKFIIGATIVSFATTLPEMLVSVFAALEGNADIAVGNAVGSVTANTGLIMCLSLVCMTCLMERRQFGVKGVYLSLLAALVGGRLVWGLVSIPIYGLLTEQAFTLAAFWMGGFVNAWPGIVLQIVLIPAIVLALEKAKLFQQH